ncbi:unnamed protein product, partial [marine sediment metagenome]
DVVGRGCKAYVSVAAGFHRIVKIADTRRESGIENLESRYMFDIYTNFELGAVKSQINTRLG